MHIIAGSVLASRCGVGTVAKKELISWSAGGWHFPGRVLGALLWWHFLILPEQSTNLDQAFLTRWPQNTLRSDRIQRAGSGRQASKFLWEEGQGELKRPNTHLQTVPQIPTSENMRSQWWESHTIILLAVRRPIALERCDTEVKASFVIVWMNDEDVKLLFEETWLWGKSMSRLE